ncbi:hypothetical protein [Streptomyces sp. NPDC005573]|uniref:hypothetical protein n=1 Tax=Streptomyces sp. NPDC005573 TaxID=3156890 RepID=UPI0033A4CF19
MVVNTPDEPKQSADDERIEPPTSLSGWRRFVEKDPATFDLAPLKLWESMDDEARANYDEARIDYHSELQVVRTSTVREVAHQGCLLTLLNRREHGARRGLIISGERATGKTTALRQPERVLRRFYAAESPMDDVRLLAIRSGRTPHLLMRQLPEVATPGSWPHEQHEGLARSWACHACVAARTGRDDWKAEIRVISGNHHLCVKHRRWTRTHHGHYMANFAGAVDGQFNLNRAPEIIHAQRRLHRLLRQRTPRRVLAAYLECVEF